jgi:hypothetical protein
MTPEDSHSAILERLAVVEVNSGFLSTLLPVQYRQYNLKSTGEQFGMMFDDAVNGTTTWLDWQAEIKTRIAK